MAFFLSYSLHRSNSWQLVWRRRMVQIVPRVLSKPSMADGNSGNSCPSRGNYCSSHLLLATIQAMARAKNPKMGKLPEWTFHLSALLFQHSDDKERYKRETVLMSDLEIIRCFHSESWAVTVQMIWKNFLAQERGFVTTFMQSTCTRLLTYLCKCPVPASISV